MTDAQPTMEHAALDGAPPQPADGDRSTAGATADRPELIVGAAFAGGLVLALLLKRLAR